MALIADISGLKGENLCSALLAHLMLRSPEVRACVIRLISDLAPQGPIFVYNQFAVFREEVTTAASTDEDARNTKRGRVDLVIETDDAVVGIENKFNAPFQEGQPAGYLELLRERSRGLSSIRGQQFTHVLVVLAPARRESEVLAAFREQNLTDVAFVTWEALINSLRQLETASPVDRFVIRELNEYAESQIGSVGDLGRLLPHLHKNWTPRGSSVHRDFMNTFIWSLLDDQVKNGDSYRCAYGNSYYGFYLRPRSAHTTDDLWIGFCERAESSRKAALLICVKSPVELPDGPSLQAVTQVGWTDYGWSCTEIAFDHTPPWQNIDTWVDTLKPLNELIRQLSKAQAS